MGLVGEVSDRVLVLNDGQVLAEGTPDAIRRDPGVIAAYLGAPA
jgi:branched-chain amino acid transport system ATP-binding protein